MSHELIHIHVGCRKISIHLQTLVVAGVDLQIVFHSSAVHLSPNTHIHNIIDRLNLHIHVRQLDTFVNQLMVGNRPGNIYPGERCRKKK